MASPNQTDTKDSGLFLYRAEIKVAGVIPGQLTDTSKGAVVEIKLKNFPPIEEKSNENLIFGPGKTVLFPLTEGEEVPLEVTLWVGDQLAGSVTLQLDDVTRYLPVGDREPVNTLLILGDAKLQLDILLVNVGHQFATDLATDKITADPVDSHDVLVFRSKGKNPSLSIEVRAPKKKPIAVLPPYHEDVAVQTEKPKKGKPTQKK